MGLSCNCIMMYDYSTLHTSCYICYGLAITHKTQIPKIASVQLPVLMFAVSNEAQLKANAASLGKYKFLQ